MGSGGLIYKSNPLELKRHQLSMVSSTVNTMDVLTPEEFAALVTSTYEEFKTRMEKLKDFKERFRRETDIEPVNKDFDSKIDAIRDDFREKLERLQRIKIAPRRKKVAKQAFKIMDSGDIDWGHRKLCRVRDSHDNFDVVNLRTLQQRLLRLEEMTKMRYSYLRNQISFNRKILQFWGKGRKETLKEDLEGKPEQYPGLPPDPYPTDDDIITRPQEDFYQSCWKPTRQRSPVPPGLLALSEGEDSEEEEDGDGRRKTKSSSL